MKGHNARQRVYEDFINDDEFGENLGFKNKRKSTRLRHTKNDNNWGGGKEKAGIADDENEDSFHRLEREPVVERAVEDLADKTRHYFYLFSKEKEKREKAEQEAYWLEKTNRELHQRNELQSRELEALCKKVSSLRGDPGGLRNVVERLDLLYVQLDTLVQSLTGVCCVLAWRDLPKEAALIAVLDYLYPCRALDPRLNALYGAVFYFKMGLSTEQTLPPPPPQAPGTAPTGDGQRWLEGAMERPQLPQSSKATPEGLPAKPPKAKVEPTQPVVEGVDKIEEPEEVKLPSAKPGIQLEKPGGIDLKKPGGIELKKPDLKKPGGIELKKPGGIEIKKPDLKKPGGIDLKKPGGIDLKKPGGIELKKAGEIEKPEMKEVVLEKGVDENKSETQKAAQVAEVKKMAPPEGKKLLSVKEGLKKLPLSPKGPPKNLEAPPQSPKGPPPQSPKGPPPQSPKSQSPKGPGPKKLEGKKVDLKKMSTEGRSVKDTPKKDLKKLSKKGGPPLLKKLTIKKFDLKKPDLKSPSKKDGLEIKEIDTKKPAVAAASPSKDIKVPAVAAKLPPPLRKVLSPPKHAKPPPSPKGGKITLLKAKTKDTKIPPPPAKGGTEVSKMVEKNANAKTSLKGKTPKKLKGKEVKSKGIPRKIHNPPTPETKAVVGKMQKISLK